MKLREKIAKWLARYDGHDWDKPNAVNKELYLKDADDIIKIVKDHEEDHHAAK